MVWPMDRESISTAMKTNNQNRCRTKKRSYLRSSRKSSPTRMMERNRARFVNYRIVCHVKKKKRRNNWANYNRNNHVWRMLWNCWANRLLPQWNLDKPGTTMLQLTIDVAHLNSKRTTRQVFEKNALLLTGCDLSFLDNRPVKSNSGVWKPEPSILHRLHGNWERISYLFLHSQTNSY